MDPVETAGVDSAAPLAPDRQLAWAALELADAEEDGGGVEEVGGGSMAGAAAVAAPPLSTRLRFLQRAYGVEDVPGSYP